MSEMNESKSQEENLDEQETVVLPEEVQKKSNPQDDTKKLEIELADFKDKYFRALAEIENSRKRLQKEKIEAQGFAIQNVVLDFLQPLDHFEQALQHTDAASPEVKHWAIGFQMILTQFKQALADNGVASFDSVGSAFDPHFHEAIETISTDTIPEGTVSKEFMPGYKMGNRIIRPAKVQVATGVVSASEEK